MVRKARTQPVTAQMYRHFAMLTLGVTLVVGIFADGEGRQAVASEVQAAARTTPHAGPTELARKTPVTHGSFGSDDFDGDFGTPMDTAGAAAQDGVFSGGFAAEAASGVPAGFTQYGVSASAWTALTDEQRKVLIARRQAEQAAAEAPGRPAQVERLLAASRARSGQASLDGD